MAVLVLTYPLTTVPRPRAQSSARSPLAPLSAVFWATLLVGAGYAFGEAIEGAVTQGWGGGVRCVATRRHRADLARLGAGLAIALSAARSSRACQRWPLRVARFENTRIEPQVTLILIDHRSWGAADLPISDHPTTPRPRTSGSAERLIGGASCSTGALTGAPARAVAGRRGRGVARAAVDRRGCDDLFSRRYATTPLHDVVFSRRSGSTPRIFGTATSRGS